jgi:hypothetical protein
MIDMLKYILTIGMIMLIACIGFATAAVPQVCAQCSPEKTYPGSAICPQACAIAFPADTKWTYPADKDSINVINDKEIPSHITRFIDELQRLCFWLSTDELKRLTDLLVPESMRFNPWFP